MHDDEINETRPELTRPATGSTTAASDPSVDGRSRCGAKITSCGAERGLHADDHETAAAQSAPALRSTRHARFDGVDLSDVLRLDDCELEVIVSTGC